MTLMAGLAPAVGKELPVVLANLEGGLMIAGITVMLLTIVGLIPLVTKLFTPTVNSVLIIILTVNLFAKGFLQSISTLIGISLLIGIGAMFSPATTFQKLPSAVAYILPNGLVVGIFIARILDNMLPKKL
ncbi:MAG TPA: hypothetical protein VM577_01865 [Anaerovoracaceae bacterium]|nr:hypothetical protein [Anaerovoracaceae bacterium]